MMPRSKCCQYSDEELRIFLCIAGYGPLSATELSKATGIRKSNLSPVIDDLLSRGVLKHHDYPKTNSRRPGRPREYLALKSPWLVQEICDELEFRKTRYEIEMKEYDNLINRKFWADWNIIANDADKSKRQDFIDKYSEIMQERINLGAENGSSSSKASLVEVDGKRTIVWRNYNGVALSLREISYQGIKYWLRRLQSPMLKVLGFLMDNPSTNYSKSEIANGAGLDTDALSNIWPKLEASKLIIVVRGDQVETYKLNMQNHDIIELMDTIGLRKMAARKGTPRVSPQRSALVSYSRK